jgi:hypothetical protein
MRSLKKIFGDRDEAQSPEKAAAPDISPPIVDSERAEQRIFEEAKKKDRIISGYRTRIGDKK